MYFDFFTFCKTLLIVYIRLKSSYLTITSIRMHLELKFDSTLKQSACAFRPRERQQITVIGKP